MSRPSIPQWFEAVLAHLVRRWPGTFSADDAKDYWAILKGVEKEYLAMAVAQHLAAETDPWKAVPMPATLLMLAAKSRRDVIEKRIAAAPNCSRCENSGLVTARYRGERLWYSFSCSDCVRGELCTSFRPFDPSKMESWREHGLKLMHEQSGNEAESRETIPIHSGG